MSTIVVATDGSPAARAAVERAIEEARLVPAALELVSAWSAPANAAMGAPTYMSEDVFYATRDAMAEILAEAKAAAAEQGVTAETHLVAGDPAAEICRVAEARRAAARALLEEPALLLRPRFARRLAALALPAAALERRR
jgi:nucleotide-binding universal stress UspA family protein